MKQSDNHIRVLLNSLPDSAILVDLGGKFLALNKAAANRLGILAEELIGVCAYSCLPPDIADFRKSKADEVIRTGNPVCFEDERDGIVFDQNIFPIFNVRGSVERLAIFARDITGTYRYERVRDKGGRRFGFDRRVFTYTYCIPERRTVSDRRSGHDRRGRREGR